MQRVSSDSRLDPQLHAIVDGVLVPNNDAVVFHPLAHLDDPSLTQLAIATVPGSISARVCR